MKAPLTGGPAFPETVYYDEKPIDTARGMTLRDYFAAKALPLAWQLEQAAPTGPFADRMEPTYKGAAQRAYYMADAMLAERGRQS